MFKSCGFEKGSLLQYLKGLQGGHLLHLLYCREALVM